ncbi:hypothetical protein RJT34_27668 [Clitoria ternatea]|uniref:E3 ubiquitin-protein ligase RMA n=1 Tax=Clitoria ternatea TaxID=43366 RepID=A0AAN9F7X7_CLITE
MELDLNREPSDQIEERIRRLEAVVFRARQRQRWRQSHIPIQINNLDGDVVTAANVQDEGRMVDGQVGGDVEGVMVESGKLGKRKATCLIAKALGVEMYKEAQGCAAKLFDCNICFCMARDPILTCCGHLFCWPCFGKLSYAYSYAKECPVCKGEVTEEGIIPIYGNASADGSSGQLELNETGLRIPARPCAPRVESVRLRQRFRNQQDSSTMQDLPRSGSNYGGSGDQAQSDIPDREFDGASVFPAQYHQEAENNQHRHSPSHQLSRLLVEGVPSFSSLSLGINSAMDSTERLFEELDSYIPSPVGSIRQPSRHSVIRDSLFSIAATNQSDNHTQDVAATTVASSSSVNYLGRN